MKLLIVTQAVDREDTNLGAFYYWFELLARHASSVVIIAARTGTMDFPSNVEVYSLGHEKGYGKIRRLWRFWVFFARHFARSDAVLFHQIPEFAIAASPFLAGRKQTAALWYAHGGVSWRLRLAERLVDDVVTSSEAGFRLPSKKVHHVGQAINTDFFSPAPPRPVRGKTPVASAAPPGRASNGARPVSKKNPLRLVSVGRISPIKDYETIINAVAILRDTWDREWTLTLVGNPITPGDFAYAEKIKAFVREKNLESHVQFLGDRHYSEIPGILREHDVFLNASRTGSLDKAVLEAMACGLPVLTSNNAYRAILPPQYFMDRPNAEAFAARIKTISKEKRPAAALRDIVMRDHALARTIEKIAALLSARVI